MGNSIGRVGLLSGVAVGEDVPFHVQLGRHVAIDLSRKEVEVDRRRRSEKWTMSYTVDVSISEFKLTRHVEKGGGAKGLFLELHSESSEKNGNISEFDFRLGVETTTETNFLVYPRRLFGYAPNLSSTVKIKQSKEIHAGRGVTETDICLHGIGEKGRLIVVERKKKNGNELPYAVTVAHYFATTAGTNSCSDNPKIDFGLSTVLKIRASSGNLDVTVEGPDQHPAFALFYLFEQVMKTGFWKPTICPHCENIQRQFSQSDGEDNNSVTVALRHGSSSIGNDGLFVGNGNGNFIDKVFMILNGRS